MKQHPWCLRHTLCCTRRAERTAIEEVNNFCSACCFQTTPSAIYIHSASLPPLSSDHWNICLPYLYTLHVVPILTFIGSNILEHVTWVPCHHGMARPQFAGGGDGLQVWKVATSILNKQSRTADKK
jgi:hypothetical protein